MGNNWAWSDLCTAADFADTAKRSAALNQLREHWQGGAQTAGVKLMHQQPVQTIAPLWLAADGVTFVEHSDGTDPVAYKLTLSGPEKG